MHKANGLTRQEILTAIKVRGSMTTNELRQELGISAVAVRQHLAALEAEKLIVTSVERRGLGRPVHRYNVTAHGDETFARSYDTLAIALLDELRHEQGEDAVTRLFAARRQRQREAAQPNVQGKPLPGRVAEIARMQTEQGYMATMTEETESLVLTEYNCAVCRVAAQHPAACDQELILFRELAGHGVRVEREKHMLAGDHTCTFRFRPVDST